MEDKKLFGDAISFGKQDANPFTISWFSSASRNMYNNGTLAVLKFRIRNDAESNNLNLSYDQENVFNIDLKSIPFHTIDGKVIVTPKFIGTTTPNPMSSSKPQNVNNESLEIGSSVKDANGAVYKVVSTGMIEYSKPAKVDKTKATIPATVSINGKRYKVTSIADRAFRGYKMLETVTIGKNVEIIGANAFYNCKKLRKITIKSKKLKAENVGKQAFKGGYSRPTVKAPKKYKSVYRKVLKTRGMSKYAIYK